MAPPDRPRWIHSMPRLFGAALRPTARQLRTNFFTPDIGARTHLGGEVARVKLFATTF